MADASDHQALCEALLGRFMDALNAYDAAGMDSCMNFPHVRMAENKLTIYDAPGANPMDLFDRLRADDNWHHSAWDHIRILQHNDDKIHLDVRYTRYRDDDSVIGVYDSLYIVTRKDDCWGIQGRSSFGP